MIGYLLRGEFQSCLVFEVDETGGIEGVEGIDGLVLDLDGEHLEDGEEIETEAVAGEGELLRLDLRALLVEPQQGGEVRENGLAARVVREDRVEHFVQRQPDALELLLQGRVHRLVVRGVAAEEFLRYL